VLARSVSVSFGDLGAKLSDDYFDLLPGQAMDIRVDSAATADKLRANLIRRLARLRRGLNLSLLGDPENWVRFVHSVIPAVMELGSFRRTGSPVARAFRSRIARMPRPGVSALGIGFVSSHRISFRIVRILRRSNGHGALTVARRGCDIRERCVEVLVQCGVSTGVVIGNGARMPGSNPISRPHPGGKAPRGVPYLASPARQPCTFYGTYGLRRRMADDPLPRKVTLIFFRTDTCREPVREWLKGLPEGERHARKCSA
jgi:hypothetical protein